MATNFDEIFKTFQYDKDTEIKLNADGTVIYVNGTKYKPYPIRNGRMKSKRMVVATKHPDPNKRSRILYVSRLVAMAFLRNPMGYPIVFHKDLDPCNTAANNLKWGTHQDKTDNALNSEATKVMNHETRKKIAKRLRAGEVSATLAEEYGVSHATITRIRKKYLRKQKHGDVRYHTEVKKRVIELFYQGFSPKEIARATGIRYETLWKWEQMTDEQLLNGPCGHIRLKDLKAV